MNNRFHHKLIDKYVIVYKCQICDALVQYGEPMTIHIDSLPDFCSKVIQNQLFAGNPYLHNAPMHTVHKCSNGDCGIANFAGLHKVES